jgi:hypothetical protein
VGKSQTGTEENLLDKIPVRIHEWEEDSEGVDVDEEPQVSIKVPRFKSRAGEKFCKWIKKSPTYGVKLDRYGSEAWRLCDGKNTVRFIAKALHEKFGEEVEPVNDRVAKLMTILELNGLITYKKVKDDS